MAKFACNNKVQLLTKQTSLFENYCLHHRFDIQDVNKIMNCITKDQVMWLVNIQAWPMFNLEEAQNYYKETVYEYHKEQLVFKV
jgi:hypothetical protein